MRTLFIAWATVLSFSAHGALLKGKALNHQKFKANLTLDKGKPIEGTVRFRGGKKAVFRAHDGTEVQIRIRPICAHGADSKVDTCWPSLEVEMDDLTSRTGVLKVSQ